jgi:hypothetical protein
MPWGHTKTTNTLGAALVAGALAAAAPTAALALDVSGTWRSSGAIQARGGLFTATPTCVFQQAGGAFTAERRQAEPPSPG